MQTWTIKYYRAGRAHQEPTKFTKKTDAENELKKREGDIAKGVPLTAQIARYRFDEAAKDITAEYTTNRRRSLGELKRRIALHLTPWFAGRKMAEITTVDVRAYQAQRLKAGAAPASVTAKSRS